MGKTRFGYLNLRTACITESLLNVCFTLIRRMCVHCVLNEVAAIQTKH